MGANFFTGILALADATIISTFGGSSNGLSVIWTPQSTSTPLDISSNSMLGDPPMDEDAIPASQIGVSVIYLFCRVDQLIPLPQKGDTIVVNNVGYDVDDVPIDLSGASTMRLRRNGK